MNAQNDWEPMPPFTEFRYLAVMVAGTAFDIWLAWHFAWPIFSNWMERL